MKLKDQKNRNQITCLKGQVVNMSSRLNLEIYADSSYKKGESVLPVSLQKTFHHNKNSNNGMEIVVQTSKWWSRRSNARTTDFVAVHYMPPAFDNWISHNLVTEFLAMFFDLQHEGRETQCFSKRQRRWQWQCQWCSLHIFLASLLRTTTLLLGWKKWSLFLWATVSKVPKPWTDGR